MHRHTHHGSNEPTAKNSEGVANSLSGTDFRSNLVCCGDYISGLKDCMKLFFDLSSLAGGIWSRSECLSSDK